MERKSFQTSEKLDEQNVLANFRVEELEKRYEMGWLSGVAVTFCISYGPDGLDIDFSVSSGQS
jgi:hypothetical protein